ncbi:hypothetical protein LOAG_14189 [Loa loa]|uniref:Uncharacterized protein n=1 Tax=Loa loa TaxID=7209 RepID=A0A1S0TJ59_LOALO|nr:hypothetical protein LOAG_14189 [Loa loa]EFO14333.2 hypothetical protein LOAG_14189 [Loa loa]
MKISCRITEIKATSERNPEIVRFLPPGRRPYGAKANMTNIFKRTINYFAINANIPVAEMNFIDHRHCPHTRNPVSTNLRMKTSSVPRNH